LVLVLYSRYRFIAINVMVKEILSPKRVTNAEVLTPRELLMIFSSLLKREHQMDMKRHSKMQLMNMSIKELEK